MEEAVGVRGVHGDLKERIAAAREGALERGAHVRREGHEGAALVRHEEAVEAFHAAAVAFRGGTIGIGGQPMDRRRLELVAAFGGVEDRAGVPELEVCWPVGGEAIALSRETRIGVPDEKDEKEKGSVLNSDTLIREDCRPWLDGFWGAKPIRDLEPSAHRSTGAIRSSVLLDFERSRRTGLPWKIVSFRSLRRLPLSIAASVNSEN